MKLKKAAAFLVAVLMLLITFSALADREMQEKGYGYIGAMEVVYCKEWVSLREKPSKTSARLAEIPLGAIVYSCRETKNPMFVKCEYEGLTGYVLVGYLKRAPKYEPPLSSAKKKKMTMEELTGSGTVVMDWKDYNMSITAAHEYVKEGKKNWEILRIGCFIDDSPVWGHEEKVENKKGQYDMLKVFIGGMEDDWKVMLYDSGYGLTMLDLLSGKDRWTVSSAECPLGDAAAVCVDEEGTVYIAGTDGPHPVAVSADGQVLWKAEISDPEIYGPSSITAEDGCVTVEYACGKTDETRTVVIDDEGDVISIDGQPVEKPQKEEQTEE